jgi:unsaturated rhamnogalacturonyl hydrolase
MAGREGNYLESSASSMFTYFLIKAAKNKYIDEKYLHVAKKAYDGILKNFITENEDGTINITTACAGAGLGGNPYRDGTYEYYINERKRDNDPKSVGPFIMLALEFEGIEF